VPNWGLDRPALVRYVDWIGGAVRGDFGNFGGYPAEGRSGLSPA
jgi:ABC-type dipeptide/oligopeptide/nickel transport system permease component